MSKIIDIGGVFERSWKLFKENLNFCLGMGAIFFVMSVFLDVAVGMIPDQYEYIGFLLQGAVLLVLQIGIIKVCLSLVDGGKLDYNELWNNAHYIWAYVGASLLMTIPIVVGLVLLILPGFYLYVRWQFFSILIIDKNLGPIQALKESWQLTKGRTLDMFLMFAVTVLLILAGSLAVGVGLIFTLPISLIFLAEMYRVVGQEVAN